MAQEDGEEMSFMTPNQTVCGECISRNLSFRENIRLAISNFCLSPRMWPVGYILDSPYSPFQLELEIPSTHWRPAFEDLLALENGHDMISMETRRKERDLSRRMLSENYKLKIEHANRLMEEYHQNAKLLARQDSTFAKYGMLDFAESFQEDIKIMNHNIESVALISKQFRAQVEPFMDLKTQVPDPRTLLKSRSQWITSLVASGVMRNWNTVLSNTDKGPELSISKNNRQDGLRLLEAEIDQRFFRGVPYELMAPKWSTGENNYPLYAPTEPGTFELMAKHNISQPDPLPPGKSILRQIVHCELIKLPSGKEVPKVGLTNHYTTKEEEEQEIVNDPLRVYRNMEEAYRQMRYFKESVSMYPDQCMRRIRTNVLDAFEEDHNSMNGEG